jgi:two-component system, NarL family, nitrate/nitrite response regulator NarL
MAATLVEPELRAATVLVVEDHVLLADGLAVSLRREGLVVEVADSASCESIMEAAWHLHPDVVLLDLVLGEQVGLSIPLIAQLRDTGARVLILTGVTDPALLGTCVEAGAAGLVSKSETFDAVLDKLLRAVRRQTTLHASDRERMLSSLRQRRADERARLEPFTRLTARERVVLGALMDGASAEEIATLSFVSMATVRSQIRSILEKLAVHSQVAAVAMAHRAHWDPC